MLVAMAVTLAAQQPAPKQKAAGQAPTVAVDPAARQELHDIAVKFAEASDVRQRVEQNLNKMIDQGKQAMLRPDSPFDPKFVDEWARRVREKVNLDDFVEITASVYATYFTKKELTELTQSQWALRQSNIATLSPELNQKLKANSARIQRDINAASSRLGSSLSNEIGHELEKEHPEWVKPTTQPAPAPAKS